MLYGSHFSKLMLSCAASGSGGTDLDIRLIGKLCVNGCVWGGDRAMAIPGIRRPTLETYCLSYANFVSSVLPSTNSLMVVIGGSVKVMVIVIMVVVIVVTGKMGMVEVGSWWW
jgi:hypothetical protein